MYITISYIAVVCFIIIRACWTIIHSVQADCSAPNVVIPPYRVHIEHT